MRWRPGELLFGVPATVLGVSIAAAAAMGWGLNPWLPVLIPLAVVGAALYYLRAIGPTPTGLP
jgi:hypothetical protein